MTDLNAAPADELATLPTVGPAAAYDLILFRPYLSWEEVEYVPGFSPERVDEIRLAGATLGSPDSRRWLLERDRQDLQA
ncbi:helix-hairpin-helix domain-containing protein [Phenylobacterium sp. J367]|uniref:ComEA family DNA-binding protein n=1 Tax=Phenylobacterium sp. J367 TaxID=2898435 RepID=UPI002150DB24|nr:helix-hairpin-helix domain-containing protein [Phenylobacterium sp. J367]MCR5879422.1 helix-hairpin-helix domain-containing protein [Phenylobacterium sp. J367]